MLKHQISVLLALVLCSTLLSAQSAAVDCSTPNAPMDHDHMDHSAHSATLAACNDKSLPAQPGQAAYGTIAEVVRMLEADSTTDWSRVNIEALRQHLIDMDEVTLHSVVEQRNVAGGLEANVTGGGRTVGAIRRMLNSHARMLNQTATYRATTAEILGGLRITVTAQNPNDSRTVARIRGLGFAGMLAEGNHHAAHHIALARGDERPHGN